MKLRYSPASPFVRKVNVVALELGLDDRIERIPTVPTDPSHRLADDNPLAKVPTLITDDGMQLYDSPLICEYLDTLAGGPTLVPSSGKARLEVLRQQALGDGALDAAVLCVQEGRRPEGERSPGWVAKQKAIFGRALDQFEKEVDSLPAEPNIGTITLGVLCGYVDFRFPGEDWRSSHPKLAKWYETFAKRPSMSATVPKDPK